MFYFKEVIIKELPSWLIIQTLKTHMGSIKKEIPWLAFKAALSRLAYDVDQINNQAEFDRIAYRVGVIGLRYEYITNLFKEALKQYKETGAKLENGEDFRKWLQDLQALIKEPEKVAAYSIH
jgi:hypothetical protein